MMLQTNWKGKHFVSIYFTVGHNPQQWSSCLFCHSGNPDFPAVKEFLIRNKSVFSTWKIITKHNRMPKLILHYRPNVGYNLEDLWKDYRLGQNRTMKVQPVMDDDYDTYLLHDIHSFYNRSKNNMTIIQPACFCSSNKELTSISVWSSIGHGENSCNPIE